MVMSNQPRRMGIAEAKAHFADIVREATVRRTIIQRRGHDVAVLIAVEELERVERRGEGATGGARFLAGIDRWRAQHGGIDDFQPARAIIRAEEPCA